KLMNKKLKIGDILYRRKGIVEHAGAYFGNDKIIHNSPDGNVQLCSLAQYSEGKDVKVISSDLTSEQAQQFQQRAKEKLNQAKGYNLVTFNCEQLVSQVLKGISKSSQIESAAFGGITGALVAKSTGSKQTFLFTVAGALLGCAVTNAQRKYDYVI
ncbi:lecithin retinol acyltransferase family protein, partial [Vibrio splendidus]